jgi:transposase-like protein
MNNTVPIITKKKREEQPLCPHCAVKLILVKVIPGNSHEQRVYRCPGCGAQKTITTETFA